MTDLSKGPQLSVQLFTLRTLPDIDAILAAVAGAGYTHVELIGSHLEQAKDIAAKLADHNLKASSSHVSMAALRADPDKILDACRQLQFTDLYMPSVPAEERQSPAEYWRSLGAELAVLADRFLKEGIRLGYHNHNWELELKDENRTALDVLFEAAGKSPLTWQADIAWIVRGGADPRTLLPRYRDRITAAHVKDLAPAGENTEEAGWADVGHGVLDWRSLWDLCVENGARWMVVEHDKPLDPVRSVTRSFNSIKQIWA